MKCSSCGKKFDYEKYYGICPRCGAYNPKIDVSETEKEQKQEWKSQREQEKSMDMDYGRGSYGEERVPKKNGTRVLVLISLIAMLISCAVIIISVSIYSGQFHVESSSGRDGKYPFELLTAPIEAEGFEPGEFFLADEESQISICVKKAEVLVDADVVPDFPKGEKLIRITMAGTENVNDWDYNDYLSDPIGNIYIGYRGEFEEPVSKYELEDYSDYVKEDDESFYGSSLNYMDTEGYLYFFIPQDVLDFSIYVENHVMQTNQLIHLYEVPFTLQEETADEE